MEKIPKSIEQQIKEFEDKLGGDADQLWELIETIGSTGQRSPEWFAARRGDFTGSRFKDIMKTKGRGAKDWTSQKTLCDLGDTALTYCIETAIGRETGEDIEIKPTWEMKRGTRLEPDAFDAAADTEHGVELIDCDYTKFLKNAGASPDGVFSDGGINTAAVEIKCAGLLKHAQYRHIPCDEKHPHFWQILGEMIATDTQKLLFFSYHPDFPESARLAKREFRRSKVHESALMFRIIICERLVEKIIETEFLDDPRELLEICIADVPQHPAQIQGFIIDNLKSLKL